MHVTEAVILQPRPALERRLDAARTRRLTVLTAPTGFGKTSLVTRWADDLNAAWHTLADPDRDEVALAGHVTEALRLRVPGLPRRLSTGELAARGPTAAHEEEERAEVLATLLCRALDEQVRRELVLVLDDVHLVDDRPGATHFLSALVRQAPPQVHTILISQTDLPFRVDRLRERGDLLEFDGSDLTLTEEETASWVVAELDEAAAAAWTSDLQLMTGGWPVATRMAIEDLRVTPPSQRDQRLAEQPADEPFTRLAQRVLDLEDEDVRHLLRAVTPLDWFTVPLCHELGVRDAGTTVASLLRRGLFLDSIPSEPDGYTLSPLAREYFVQHVPLAPSEVDQIRDVAARWWLRAGRYDEHLRTRLASGRVEPLRVALREVGERLVTTGHADLVLRAVEAIGPTTDPDLQQLTGVAAQLRGDWDRAKSCFEQVAVDRDELDAGLAWRLGLIHHLRGELDEALEVYRRGRVPDEPSRDGALLLTWTATVHWLRGESDDCAELAGRALDVASASDDPQGLAAAHTVLAMLAALEGDRRANDAHYLRALDLAESAGDVLQVVRIRNNRASHHLEEGSYHEALAELEIAIDLAESTGYGPFAAMALSNRAEARLRLGELEHALDDLLAAVGLWRRIGSRMVSYPLGRLGDLFLLRGDRASARARYEEALQEARAAADLQGLVPAVLGLSRLELRDDPEQARILAEEAVNAGDSLGLGEALLATARAAIATGDLTAARAHAERAASLAAARRDRAGTAEALEVSAQLTEDDATAKGLLDESIAAWRQVGDPIAVARASVVRARLVPPEDARAVAIDVRERMRGIGCRLVASDAEALLADLDRSSPSPVQIETLGGFRVLLDGVVVPNRAWQSRKARDLLKILVSRRGRPTTRDALMEHLWPDEDPDRTANRFNVALATVRAVLDPDRVMPTDTYVVTEQDAAHLDLTRVDVDVERFLADAAEASRLQRASAGADAVDVLRRAEGTYAGGYLEEDMYEDWAIGLREEARATYLDVAGQLAAHARQHGELDDAVRYLLRILEHDPYDERAHLDLVTTLAEAGRHGEARRRYLVYHRAVQDLGVEPAPFPAAGRPLTQPEEASGG